MDIDFTAIFCICGTCVVLPLLIVWFTMKSRINTTNKRTEIILAALEKNNDVDIEDLLKKMSPKKSAIMRLLNRQLWGYICLIAGVILEVTGIILCCLKDEFIVICVIGGLPLALGIALLINYYTGKKYLDRIEEELK